MKLPLVTEAEILDHVKNYEHQMLGYRTTDGNIAAIGFGTTSVTLAYKRTWDEEISILVPDTNNIDTKVPNAILLRKHGASLTIFSFGHVARNLYTIMRPNDRKNHVYFERIKMLMKREEVHILISFVPSI